MKKQYGFIMIITMVCLLLMTATVFAEDIEDPDSTWYGGELQVVSPESDEIPLEIEVKDQDNGKAAYTIYKPGIEKTYTNFPYVYKVLLSRNANNVWIEIPMHIKEALFYEDQTCYLAALIGANYNNRVTAYSSLKRNVLKKIVGDQQYSNDVLFDDHQTVVPDEEQLGDYEYSHKESIFNAKRCYSIDVTERNGQGVDKGVGFNMGYFTVSPNKIDVSYVNDFAELTEHAFNFMLYFVYAEDQDAIDKIAALPEAENVTLDDVEAIKAAREAYDLLANWEGAQDGVDVTRLIACEAKIEELEEAIAKPVKDAISALPKASELTLNDKANVEAARAAYEALSSEVKEYVDNITTLELAEATIAKLEAEAELAQAKEKLNEALGNDEPENDIDKLAGQVEQAKEDLKKANEELAVAKETAKIQKVVIKKVKVKAQKKKATVSWKSAGKGYQYEVFKSTKVSGGFKKAVTTKKVKAVVKKLKSKKTYYIKVRAFKTVNGKKVYTQYSDTVSVKVK